MSISQVESKTLREHADERRNLHKGHRTSTPYSDDYELVGLAGEVAFAKWYEEYTGCEIEVDLELRSCGDGGKDFVTRKGYKVEVRTARKPYHLLHKKDEPFRSDVYVLAKYYDDTETAEVLGWTWTKELKKCPIKNFGYVDNYSMPQEQLRPMPERRNYPCSMN